MHSGKRKAERAGEGHGGEQKKTDLGGGGGGWGGEKKKTDLGGGGGGGGGECAAEKAVQPTVLPCRAAFTIAMVTVKWTGRICQFVCIKYTDGRSLKVKVRKSGTVADLRAAVAARTEVAATTLALFVTGRDGEELRDNQPLVDVVGRNAGEGAGTVFALTQDAHWTCAACFCANGRSAAACTDCQLPRPSTKGQTAELQAAAEAGRLEGVLALVAAAAPLDAPGAFGETALHNASSAGHAAIAEALLAAGADPHAKSAFGETALHIGSRHGHAAIAEALLAAGADPNAALSDGRTALHFACTEGHPAVVEALLAAGARKDATSSPLCSHRTPLSLAIREGHLAVVQALLAAGADVQAKNSHGDTALHS
jgi:hypothetical protein